MAWLPLTIKMLRAQPSQTHWLKTKGFQRYAPLQSAKAVTSGCRRSGEDKDIDIVDILSMAAKQRLSTLHF